MVELFFKKAKFKYWKSPFNCFANCSSGGVEEGLAGLLVRWSGLRGVASECVVSVGGIWPGERVHACPLHSGPQGSLDPLLKSLGMLLKVFPMLSSFYTQKDYWKKKITKN